MIPFSSTRVILPLVVGAASAASAADFSVHPIRIFMTSRDRAVAVTVANKGDEEIVMQAEVYAWKQKPDGDEDLSLTEDLILSPPILKLPPKSQQVLRLARLTPPPAGEQATYRMIVREVPEARPSRSPEITVAVAFSLPVFVTPPGTKSRLECRALRVSADTVNASCSNSGTAYAQLREFALHAAGGEVLATREMGGYVLPGITRAFELKRPGGRISGGKVSLQAALDDGTTQVFETTLDD